MTPTVTGITRVELVVVGGGAIGTACARAAAARGLIVALCEPGPAAGAASPASAGMLAAQIEPGDDWWLDLAVRARDRYPALAETLRKNTGIDIGLRREGIATLGFTAERAHTLSRDAQRQEARGLAVEWLSPLDVHTRWPGAAPGCTGALNAPADGAVDAPTLTGALTADAARLGVTLVRERVIAVQHVSATMTGVVTASGTMAARHVVIAAGAWSAALAGLPRALPVTPVRGQLLQTPWPAGMAPAILYHDHGYVLYRGGQAILGSTMEHVGFDARVSESARTDILASARRLLPALGEPERQWAGLRPITPDGLPIIGPDPEIDGLWYATGHGRNGILLAPLTGEVIAEWIVTGTTTFDAERLGVERFAGATSQPASGAS
jgi:glycine oxidase